MISPNYVTETFHPAFPSPMSAAGMASSTTTTNGITAQMSTPIFQSISLSSNQLNGLASDLSEMAIGDRPPPRKIRRRNALTVQDPHYPHVVPPPNSPVHDPFEDSSRMQALDEIVRRDFTIEDDTRLIDEPRRKIAGKSKGPKLPGEDREVRQILLHRDLENFQVEQCLPDTLVRKYVKAVKSSLHNPCSALVPYQPPEKLLTDILKSNNGKDDSPALIGDMETDE
eukprot:09641.XXX_464381_465129_1 [CDS] Oithona nana genome sequencing.